MTTPIPGPRALPLIGNMLDVQAEVPIEALENLVDIYGPLYKLSFEGIERYFLGNFALFDELCDETRFYKLPLLALTQMAPPGPRGLFAQASEKEPDWLQAHRILMPAFGPLAVEGMFAEMHDIASQMVMKWARMGPDRTVVLTEDFTRLTLDTIALCSMDYRFNSFYAESMHPYVRAMHNTLLARSQASQIGHRLKVLLQPSYQAGILRDFDYMRQVGEELVQHRRDNPTDKRDLLNSMIYGRDPQTGASMRDELIAANMQTFLIAGHETTSGLLSFAFMYMLLNPSTWAAAQAEVDRVISDGRIEPKHLKELPYVEAVLRETLRLCPTAPAITRGVRPENKAEHVTVADGKYEIPRGIHVLCLLRKIQRDPAIFGADADSFQPERMLDDKFEKLPKNAWKPFGTGLRACIGRAFAWQEAVLVMALVLQNFQMSLEDPNYEMKVMQTLTIKPKNTFVRVRLRSGITATQLMGKLANGELAGPTNGVHGIKEEEEGHASSRPKLAILYGSNMGTCQSLAQSLAAEAADRGYDVTMADLDSVVDSIPTDRFVVIVTASYEGQPPDNAARFVAWLEKACAEKSATSSAPSSPLFENVRFSVFGCGHKDWPATFHRIPTLIDTLLAEHGAVRLADRGITDVAAGDVAGDFARWTSGHLWPAIPTAGEAEDSSTQRVRMPRLQVTLATAQRAEHLQQKMVWATVTATRQLTAAGEPEKWHTEFALPPDVSYAAGDYLAVLPLNPEEDVRRAMRRFELPWDAVITIAKSTRPTPLPTDKPMAVAELLRGYVELAQPATTKDITILAEVIRDAETKKHVAALAEPATYAKQILGRRTSLLDLLEQQPSAELPLASFLAMLPPLRVRQYSIASSPLATGPHACTLCYSVRGGLAWSATDAQPRPFRGVASTYLRSLVVGEQALVAVRTASNRFFRLPKDPHTPLVLCCAGSGLAPFMGFLQERAALLARDSSRDQSDSSGLAPALLFIGCRDPVVDRLYADQIDAWVQAGVVDVRYAFSRKRDDTRAVGCARVPERLRHDAADVVRLWAAGARFYICGHEDLADSLRTALGQLMVEWDGARVETTDVSETEAAEVWLRAQADDRVVADVFS